MTAGGHVGEPLTREECHDLLRLLDRLAVRVELDNPAFRRIMIVRGVVLYHLHLALSPAGHSVRVDKAERRGLRLVPREPA